MNANLISALSALAGAVIGGIMSLLASWVPNQRQVRSEWIAHDRSRREDLYKEFIEEAAKCYIDALLHEKPDISSIVVLYAKNEPYARPVITSAYRKRRAANPGNYKYLLRAGKTFAELQAIKYETLDIIRNFSESCRAEFDDLRARHF